MEVAHRDDHVTNAVIGGGEKIEAQIVSDPIFMQMLSANLYSDQELAVVRETICNADDAHKEAKQARPFEVILDKEKFVVKDFGPGIPHDKMGEVYLTYGKSTKKNKLEATGGFGLGCKSPFAYTDNFEVISCHSGIKTIYRMSRSDAEVGGAPSLIKILSIPTTETGLTVTISLKNAADHFKFQRHIEAVLRNGGMNALFNGVQANVIDYSLMTNDYLIVPLTLASNGEDIMVKYGAVLYPINHMEEYSTEWRYACGLLAKHPGFRKTLILNAKPGSLSLTPSREELSMQTETIKAVKALLTNFNESFGRQYNMHAQAMHKAVVQQMIQDQNWPGLFAAQNKKIQYKETLNKLYKPKEVVSSVQDMAALMLHHEYPGDHAFAVKDARERLLGMARNGFPQRGMAQSLAKEFTHTDKLSLRVHNWMLRNVYAPLNQIIWEMSPAPKKGEKNLGVKYLTQSRLFLFVSEGSFYETSRYHNTPYVYDVRRSFHEGLSMLGLVRKYLFIVHDTDALASRMHSYYDEKKHGQPNGSMVYQTQRNKTAIAEAREFAKRAEAKGFTVFMLIDDMDYKEPRKHVPKGQGVKKPSGLVTLASMAIEQADGNYRFDYQNISKGDVFLDKPEAITPVYSRSSHYDRTRLPGFSKTETSQLVFRLFGERIGVVRTGAQEDAYKDKGADGLILFVSKQLAAFFAKKENQGILSWSDGEFRSYVKEQDGRPAIVELFSVNEQLRKAVKWTTADYSEDQRQYFKLLNMMFSQLQTANSHFSASEANKLLYPFYEKTLNCVPPKFLPTLVEKVKNSKTLDLLDPQKVRSMLTSELASDRDFATKLLIKGLKG